MQLDEIQRRSRELFRLEATDLLRELEAALLELEGAPDPAPFIDRVFRVMHTLKGSGATSGYHELSAFLHHVEEVYTAAREGRLAIDTEIIDLTLKLADAVSRHLSATPADAPGVLTAAQPHLDALLRRLPAAAGKKPATAAAPAAPVSELHHYALRFAPHTGAFHHGFDPGMFLDGLRALGACTVHGRTDRLPSFTDLMAEECHLRWEIELATSAPESAVREVFAFIQDECDLELAPATPAAATQTWYVEFQTTRRTLAAPAALETLWRDLTKLGTHRVVSSPPSVDGRPAPGTWCIALETTSGTEAVADAFVFLIDSRPVIRREPFPGAALPAAASAKAAAAPPAAARASNEMLRVSAERLDRLVNLVGELVILRSQVATVCSSAINLPAGLQGASESLQSLSTEMRNVVLNLRMMPIEQTFGKFRRLVRDLSHDLGKEIDLQIEGAETEMDKTMLDALADPLMHLVRNSLDHGVETVAERVAAGKPPRGTIKLRAEQRGDRVVVSVIDDGRGLDSERIRAKAIARGLLAAEARPTESELHQFIFLPGFSTAATVSNISGRGVGLDVVRRQVDQMRGRVEVRSERGRGVEFHLSLPLTLAIIEGLMVEVDGDRYILPLSIAREAFDLSHARRTAGNGRNVVELRGGLVPYIRLRDLFAFTTEPPATERVVVLELEDRRLGIVVDRVIGNHQTVLKSLGWLGRHVTLFSGATVLGDGRVALVLDVPALLAHHQVHHEAAAGMEV